MLLYLLNKSMRVLGEISMEYIENLFINNDHDDNIELSSETPIGWSSMCFDQTINYYIECNSINACQEENTEKSN